jgi:hypothetical protein
MRVSAALFAFLRLGLVACLLVQGVARAQPAAEAPRTPGPPQAEQTPPDPTAGARRHFKTGIKLYQDANYPGALAEFEAAYQLKPGASSLQNVALCQKALFRYGEAADTLTLLLERHADELSADEQKGMRQAIEELEGLVGSLLIKVQPPHARVALDGQVVSAEQRGKRLRTNVGEHSVVAEAPGYARAARTVRVASGQHDQPVELSLEPMMGFLEIVASDPEAYVALDGKPLAKHRWSGPVTPDEEHLVQVYRQGFTAFEQLVQVSVGKTAQVRGVLGPALEGEEEIDLGASGTGLPPPPGDKSNLGWYGMLSLSLLGVGETPLELEVQNARASTSAGAIGLRGGYRFWKPIAGELMLDFGNLKVTNACDPNTTPPRPCGMEGQVLRDYRMSWMRLGPNLRFMSGGDRVRFVAGAGVGAVFHRLELDAYDEGGVTAGAQDAFGVDPYFALELGIGFNFGHWLMEAVALASIDGTRNLRSDLEGGANRNTLPIVGLSLKFGYSQWKSR